MRIKADWGIYKTGVGVLQCSMTHNDNLEELGRRLEAEGFDVVFSGLVRKLTVYPPPDLPSLNFKRKQCRALNPDGLYAATLCCGLSDSEFLAYEYTLYFRDANGDRSEPKKFTIALPTRIDTIGGGLAYDPALDRVQRIIEDSLDPYKRGFACDGSGSMDGVVVLMAEVLAAMHGRVKRLETRYKVTPRGNGTWDVETEPELVQGTRPVAVEPTPSGASDYLWEGVAKNVLPTPSGASKDLWGQVADKVMPVPMPGQQYNRAQEVRGLPAARYNVTPVQGFRGRG